MTDRRGLGIATLGGGSLALFIMVGRWTPGRVFGRSDWWALPPRVWAIVGLSAAVMTCFLVPNRATWAAPARAHVRRTALFLGYMMISASWSNAGVYAGEKAALLGLVLLAAVLSAKLVHDTGAWMARSFWMWMAVATGAYAIYTAMSGWSVTRLRIQRLSTPLGGGPNVFARLTSLLTLAGINYGTRGALWSYWYGFAALGVVLTIATGSRGGLLAGIVGLVAMAEAKGVFRRRGMLPAAVLVGLLVSGVALTGLWDKAVIVFQQRVVKMTFEQRDDAGRQSIFRQAWRLGLSAPILGNGLGGFYAANPTAAYPHNLFLEAFAEGGLVGVAL